LAPVVRDAVKALDPNVPLSEIQTMDSVVAGSTSRTRFYLVLLTVFAGVAVALAAVGIYGVVSYSVSRRTHEIGLRVALGAAPRTVLAQIVGEGMRVVACGAIAGIAGACALTRLMSGLLFGVSPLDPLTFVATTAALGAIALAATLIPARRASATDPLAALRTD
jgi:putative ABC transport system permease protein